MSGGSYLGTSTRADACALQAYAQLPAPLSVFQTTSSIQRCRFPAHPSISGACFAPRHEHYCLSGQWCLASRDCRQSKDTRREVHRHQQIHIRTCHCHWQKPEKQVTSQLKFEPHLDRQCLIIFNAITFVLDR